ncbi:MAG: hypothetical protein IKC82_06785 [Lentisphaeria bacterium]|nr:hypothetical protein [Lentisphaeria bacterium]
MKKFTLFSFLSILFSLTVYGGEVAPAGVTDWVFEGNSLRCQDGISSYTGFALYSRGFIPVDPAKKYVVSGEFRTANGSKPAKFQLGVVSLDSNRRIIRPENAIVVAGSGAAVVNAAPAGSKNITVKTIHRWNPKIKAYIVAKADNSGKFSDLPNFNVINEIAGITVKDGKILEVALKKPLSAALAAGESIRLHVGGAMHVCSKPVIAGNDWMKFSHVISGYSKGHTQTNFRHGAKFAKIFLLHNRGTKLEFKNITLKELPAESK